MQLVINTRGSLLRRRGDRIEIRREGISHEFSATKIHSIIIATGVRFTSNVIHLASDHNIDIVFLDSTGNPTSRVWQTRMGSTATIRRRQLEASLENSGLQYALEWVSLKIKNQVKFLQELKLRRPATSDSIGNAIAQIESILHRIEQVPEQPDGGSEEILQNEIRGSVMGFEGSAGRIYFGTLSRLLPKEYRFSTRSRRPAVDPFNAMLNYGYGVLYGEVERALILAGLDPFIGFLHTDNYNKRSLVYDMIEPFRIIAERTTTLFFTGRRIKTNFTRAVPGGVELSPDGRAALIESLNIRLDKTVRYPIQRAQTIKPGPQKSRNIKLRETIRHEAHGLANRLLGKTDIPQLITSNDLFGESDS